MSSGHRFGDLDEYCPELLEYLAWLIRRRKAREWAQRDIAFASLLRVAFHGGAKPFRDTIAELRDAYERAGGMTAEEMECRKRLARGGVEG